MSTLEKIEALTIGPAAASLSFSKRMARENSWFWLKVLFGAWIVYKVMVWMGKHSKGGGDGGCGSACGGCGGGD